jgi:predicted HAD superfamily hydrolase
MRSEQIPQQELFDLIDECDVISFDVFETLVWRIYNTPIDLFKHMEASLRVPGFANTRSQAEVRAREVAQEGGRHEVSLDDIYKQMPVRLHKYKQKEIEVEEDCTRQDAWMYAAYRYAVDKGKRIFFASDMYLPGVVIEKMLQKAGYSSPDRFFLSSINNRPKATGAMFEDIIQHSQVPAHRILHIGDNFHGDWAMANAAGLRTYLYVPAIERYGAIAEPALFDTLASTPHADDPASSLIRGLVAQFNMAEPEADFWERFGYRYGGPIAYAFCAWIKSQTDENEIEAVHFLARDGHVFKEAFDRLYPGLNTTYLYASRRCYLLAALRQVDKKFLDLIANDHLLERYSVPWTFRDILEQLALDDRSLSEAFERQFPRMDEAIRTSEQLTEIRAFFKTHEAGLLSAGKSERETLMNYFRKEGLLSGKIALVDLGWKGTLPRTIKEILKLEKQAFDPLCLYFGTHEHDA